MVENPNTHRDRYAVFGNPVAHSLSPQIHSMFAEQLDQALEYEAILVELDQFEPSTEKFFLNGGKGLSITIPFKEQAFAFANQLTPRAELAGAVNTLSYDGQCVLGDNTDGIGLVNDIVQNHQRVLKDKDVLILGAGGSVRGILGPLAEQSPHQITICNRTLSKAEALVTLFEHVECLHAVTYSDLTDSKFDVVINATSTSLHGLLPPLPESIFATAALSYDLMYSQEHTVFQQWSEDHGAEMAVDGLGMLVEQAAEAFYLWRGLRPQTQTVIEQFTSH